MVQLGSTHFSSIWRPTSTGGGVILVGVETPNNTIVMVTIISTLIERFQIIKASQSDIAAHKSYKTAWCYLNGAISGGT